MRSIVTGTTPSDVKQYQRRVIEARNEASELLTASGSLRGMLLVFLVSAAIITALVIVNL